MMQDNTTDKKAVKIYRLFIPTPFLTGYLGDAPKLYKIKE